MDCLIKLRCSNRECSLRGGIWTKQEDIKYYTEKKCIYCNSALVSVGLITREEEDEEKDNGKMG